MITANPQYSRLHSQKPYTLPRCYFRRRWRVLCERDENITPVSKGPSLHKLKCTPCCLVLNKAKVSDGLTLEGHISVISQPNLLKFGTQVVMA